VHRQRTIWVAPVAPVAPVAHRGSSEPGCREPEAVDRVDPATLKEKRWNTRRR
jgi:hypothetical protein